MRRQHQPGAMIEVDYAGMTLPIRIGDTIRTAAVFACLPYSGYLFAEATWTQAAEDWLASHVRLFAHLGGVPASSCPTTSRPGSRTPRSSIPWSTATISTSRALRRRRRPDPHAAPARQGQRRERGAPGGAARARALAPPHLRVAGGGQSGDRGPARPGECRALSANPAVSRLSLFRDEEQAALRPLPPEPFVIGRWSRLKVPP